MRLVHQCTHIKECRLELLLKRHPSHQWQFCSITHQPGLLPFGEQGFDELQQAVKGGQSLAQNMANGLAKESFLFHVLLEYRIVVEFALPFLLFLVEATID